MLIQIGRCSLCSGRVCVTDKAMFPNPEQIMCESCGATKRDNTTIIEMKPAERTAEEMVRLTAMADQRKTRTIP